MVLIQKVQPTMTQLQIEAKAKADKEKRINELFRYYGL